MNWIPEGSGYVIDRRGLLRGLVGVGLGGLGLPFLAVPDAQASSFLPRDRSITLRNYSTGETVVAKYCVDNRYQYAELNRINLILRDHHTDEAVQIDLRLVETLRYLRDLFGNPKAAFGVTSGYRSPKTNARLAKFNERVAQNSFHMRGMAVDFRLEGVKISALHKALLSLKYGGVARYGDGDFLHFDVGPMRRWS